MFISKSCNFILNVSFIAFAWQSTAMSIRNIIKINKSDLYHENHVKLNDWFMQMNVYFTFNNVFDDKQTLFAFTYLWENTKNWFKTTLRPYFENEKNDDNIINDYNNFKKKIWRVYDIFNEKQAVEKKIQHIAQIKSTVDYIAKFIKHANLTEWNDAIKMIMFRREFKPHVKKKFMRWGTKIDTLKNLIETVIEINNKWYELQQETHHVSREKSNIYVGQNKRNYKKRFQGGNKNKSMINMNIDYYEFAFMKLDVIIKHKKKFFKRKKSESKNIKCYNCDISDHIARNCHKRNMMSQQQLNVMLNIETKNNQKEIQKQEILDFNSNDEYFHVKNKKEFQKTLNDKNVQKQVLSFAKISKNIKTISQKSRLTTTKNDYLNLWITSKEENSDDEKFRANLFTNILKKKLESNASIKKNLSPNTIKNLLNNDIFMNENNTKKSKKNFIQSTLIQDKFNQNPDLKRTQLEEYWTSYQCEKKINHLIAKYTNKKHWNSKHKKLHFTKCYDDDCSIHFTEKKKTNYYFKKPKRGKEKKPTLKWQNAVIQNSKIKNQKDWELLTKTNPRNLF